VPHTAVLARELDADRAATEAEALLASRPLAGRKILIIVENLPVPFDRRVWQEARTLVSAGAVVSVICPTGKGFTEPYEFLDGVHVYRHPLPTEASGALGYLVEYGAALFHEARLAWRVWRRHGFDTIHGCNPPDLIFLVALLFRPFGVRYVFDQHDIGPELYEAKFGRRGPFWKLLALLERLSFGAAKVAISTNESYRRIAIERGGKSPESVFIVRSGPDLSRLKPVAPDAALRKGRAFLVGYVGVMGEQEGIDLLLEAVRHIVHGLGRKDIQFCLVGGGPSLDGLRELAAQLEVADHVTFTGRAPDQELFAVLSTADVCVNPDRVNEMNDKSTMNKIMEYMAFRKPIVQFEVAEGRFSAQEASLYARPNDSRDLAMKIVHLVDSPAERAWRGAFGHDRLVQNLTWPHEAPKLIAAYLACGD
jgi:glycosyltransferase involved in cell wall biosynthesis